MSKLLRVLKALDIAEANVEDAKTAFQSGRMSTSKFITLTRRVAKIKEDINTLTKES